METNEKVDMYIVQFDCFKMLSFYVRVLARYGQLRYMMYMHPRSLVPHRARVGLLDMPLRLLVATLVMEK